VRKDEPVKEEVFLKKYAEQVKLYKNTIDVLFSDNSCLRVAIKGDWGAGKTTLLRALASLYEEEKALVVRFEAWKYALEEDPFIPLLEEISSIGDSTFKKKIKNIAKVLGVTTAVITETFLKQSLIPTDASSIESWFKKFEDFLYRKKSERNKKLELLKKTIEELRERKDCDKFILAVDDLDRLVPERAFRLLEILYLYFDIPGSIIIMAVNDTVLNAYVEKHYGIKDSFGNFHFQEEFLDQRQGNQSAILP
jgi:predicted KAP-like P-loop ATPase